MKFQINEAPLDRAARLVLGIVLVATALAAAIATPVLYVVWLVAGLLLVTGTVGFCPLYAVLRVSTKHRAR